MALKTTSLSGSPEGLRALSEDEDTAGSGAGGPFPGKMPGLPGDKTTGAGKGKGRVRQVPARAIGAPPELTVGGGAKQTGVKVDG